MRMCYLRAKRPTQRASRGAVQRNLPSTSLGLLSKSEGLTKQLLTTTTLAKQLSKSLRALVPSKELTNFTAAGRIGFKYIYRELPNLSDRLYIETDWQKIPQRERLPIPSRQYERRFTGSICSTRSEHSRRRTTDARRIQPIKWAKSFSSSNVRCSIMPHRTFKHFMCRRSTKNDRPPPFN